MCFRHRERQGVEATTPAVTDSDVKSSILPYSNVYNTGGTYGGVAYDCRSHYPKASVGCTFCYGRNHELITVQPRQRQYHWHPFDDPKVLKTDCVTPNGDADSILVDGYSDDDKVSLCGSMILTVPSS